MFSTMKGLAQSQVEENRAKFGKNILPEKPAPSDLTIFVRQLTNPLVYVLVFAGSVSVYLKHFSDAVIIAAAVVINAVFGFIQERQAGKALQELKKLITFFAEVIRSGVRKKVEVSEVVMGDYVLLSAGAKVPADGLLVQANRFFVDESLLTGESVPLSKAVNEPVFMGTKVVAGQAVMRVTQIGEGTEMGKIALSIKEIEHTTPLHRQLVAFSKQILIVVLTLTALVFITGFALGEDLGEIFQTAVALAVSSIPEGLLVSLTVVLAIGMRRILKKKGLVKNLTSAETLGGVTTICLDKTGTLTQGKMTATAFLGNKNSLSLQAVLANDLDDSLVISAFNWGVPIQKGKKNVGLMQSQFSRLDSIPFSAKTRFFVSLNKWQKGKNIIFVNGAPDILLKFTNLPDIEKKNILRNMSEYTKEGKRLLGFIRKTVPSSYGRINDTDLKAGFEWVGLLAFDDPVRLGVKESLQKTMKSGIKLIVITGDYPGTAAAVMSNLGMPVSQDETIVGEELENLSLDSVRFRSVKLFARTTPDQKLKIVEALKKNGETVAMMGDGVNDAPALNRADIGIVVGDATDVSKESADLILIDSNFQTIIDAIEEGRGIFDNLRKIILYLMSGAFAEIVAVVGALILRLPLPVSPSQILWINLVSDGFPSVSLSVDPKRRGIMGEVPRRLSEKLVTGWMKTIIIVVSLTSGIVALTLFVYFLNTTGNSTFARSVAFASLGVSSLVYIYSVRGLTDPFWKENPFRNKWLNTAVLVGFVLQIIPFISAPMRNFWGIEALPVAVWGLVIVSSSFVLGVVEILKLTVSARERFRS